MGGGGELGVELGVVATVVCVFVTLFELTGLGYSLVLVVLFSGSFFLVLVTTVVIFLNCLVSSWYRVWCLSGNCILNVPLENYYQYSRHCYSNIRHL